MGSYIGSILSIFMTVFILMYMFIFIKQILQGYHDEYEYDMINHGFQDKNITIK